MSPQVVTAEEAWRAVAHCPYCNVHLRPLPPEKVSR
jgi:hypothetical protein